MQFRNFGKLGLNVSALGFGCMRLPTIDGKPISGNINEEESIRMIRFAIDQGVNYIDTAYPYHKGNSEIVVGKALKEGYREKVKLATKSPVWLVNKAEDFDSFLNEQLKKLQTQQIDIYLFHALNKLQWDNVLKLNLLKKAETAVRDGRIGSLGFSFHDTYDSFEKIIDGYDRWVLCQIQYNYMDTENQAGTKGLLYAASKGIAVVVMEPLLGGRLANPPRSVQALFDGFEKRCSPADWALQWVWNQPEVSLVLSGMNTMKQVEENIHSAKLSGVNSFGPKEAGLIELVREKFKERTAIPCTKCGYCMPCPNGVNIPRNFELYNDAVIYDNPEAPRMTYMRFLDEKERANVCIQCRICEEKCPQKIVISELLSKVHSALAGE
ncbi:MAG: aldo/keto reductase [Candidatus Latescibacterota bacterium]